MKGKRGAPAYLRVVKGIETRSEVLKSVHDGVRDTVQSKSLRGHVGRDKSWWMLTCGGQV